MHLHLGALERTVKQTPEQEGLLVGDVLRQRDAKLGAFAFDPGGDRVDGVGPRRLSPGDQRRAQARRIVDVGVVETAPVADPAFVDVVVLVRCDAHQLPPALPLRHAAADRASGADRLAVGHVPRTRLEAPDAGGEGADRAEVDDVAAEDRLQGLIELARDEGLHPALIGGQLLLPGDLVVVAGAAIAEHTPLAVESDLVRHRDGLLEMKALAVDSARRIAVTEREVLQRTLASLIVNRTVERVVRELELEDVGARLHRHRALRAHDHSFRHRRGAGGLRPRRSGREVDQAQPARAHRVELVVVAEHRDLDADGLRRLDDEGAGRDGELVTVDGEVDIRHLRPRPYPWGGAGRRPPEGLRRCIHA